MNNKMALSLISKTLMRKFFLISFALLSSGLFACSCDIPKKSLEFLDAEYVFKGLVSDKTYSTDSLTYRITIDRIRHFKNSIDKPKTLDFVFKSEFDKVKTSCDFFIDEGEFLLVYAKKHNNQLIFDLMCSNSKRLRYGEINENELSLLQNMSDFKFSKYIFENQEGFNSSRNITNIDSLIANYSIQKYSKSAYGVVMIDISEKGNLITANLYSNNNYELEIIDNTFDLNYIKNQEYKSPESQFEKDILEIAQNIKKWEPFIHQKSSKKVKHRKYLKFYLNENGKLVCEY